MKVLKFGGSSVSDSKRIQRCIDIILKSKDVKAVVFSATGGSTDQLINISNKAASGDQSYRDDLKNFEERHLNIITQLIDAKSQTPAIVQSQMILKELEEVLKGVYYIKEASSKTKDLIMSCGERLSALIISEAIKQQKPVEFLDTRSIFITNNDYGNADVDMEVTKENIIRYFDDHEKIQIVTGFIGSTKDNITTTLGRGGSDLTASILGAALEVDEIEIWTDVDGILTTDPRLVEGAFPIDNMSYIEAMELSHFGAKVIYPPTMRPASVKNIPIRIKNSFNPDFQGTLISSERISRDRPVTGISSISDVSLMRLQGSGMVGVAGVSKRLFGTLADAKISIILISQASSEHTICFAVSPEDALCAKRLIDAEFNLEICANLVEPVVVEDDMTIIAAVGENMRRMPGIAGKLFQTLGDKNVNVVAVAQGSSELNVSIVIDRKDEARALNALHKRFFKDTKEIDIFIVGIGTIGGELIEQLKKSKYLNNGINVRGIANSKKMLLGNFDLNDWMNDLEKSDKKADIGTLIEFMKSNYSNNVFVDCTASKNIVNYYEQILQDKISIVTPNKIANSSSMELYKKFHDLSKDNTKFLYETNAGAGLPVIVLVRDLIDTGDNIEKIEGVLSGTLSYIFNSFKDKNFSEVVREARQKGYTEPDPRDDLNGMDVARKVLILGRETGMNLELEDIEVENLVPEKCRGSGSVDDFFNMLESMDAEFEDKRKKAENEGKVLRYIATLEKGSARVALEAVDSSHPFYSLEGADNMVSFTTSRYKERPLVVRGPGAGAKVTAMGVFADILKVLQ
ncbi:bifunctional aspartate kinase/homoserine dehydrogenase I [Candidatus Woesearchaeota archaeon]|nr:bifunctional aspartate kinase/homoserine dehydrogenase I [Candidatus Woesearchaeota archaeon]